MRNRMLVMTAVLAAWLLPSCGSEAKCQVAGENCSSAYKTANNITYGCCSGLSCQSGTSGVLVCK